jgi:hypothetical protein
VTASSRGTFVVHFKPTKGLQESCCARMAASNFEFLEDNSLTLSDCSKLIVTLNTLVPS